MQIKKHTLLLGALAWAMALNAELPAGYYDSLVGQNNAGLAAAIQALAEGHTEISYGNDSWAAFATTNVITVKGRQAWRDIYSNNIVYLPGHDAMNIEHTVANSWWGKEKNAAYKDLFHLNPSDQVANGKKSNYPPGKVGTATLYDNGVFSVGTPASGFGGSAKNVYEPADEYKGDFARAILYVFTAYPEIGWMDDYAYMFRIEGGKAVLEDWALTMLMEWDTMDPVDTREKERNEAIYALQGNRNPFIDIEGLTTALYTNADLYLECHERPVVDRPEAPVFHDSRLTGLNTYNGRWWEEHVFDIDCQGELWLSWDGLDYDRYDNGIRVPAASADGQKHVIKAYTVHPSNSSSDHSMRSPVSFLTLRAYDPATPDWTRCRWEAVTEASAIDTENYYLLLSANTLHTMSTTGGTSSQQFMESGGFVDFDAEDEYVVELPDGAAMVKFSKSADTANPYNLGVYDMQGNFKGYWNATAKNKMKLDANTATPAKASFDGTGDFKFTFSQYGSLQFNKTQPRFLNYESNQGGVKLYRYKDHDFSGIAGAGSEDAPAVTIDGNNILVPAGCRIFDLGGREVNGLNLNRGVYIVARPNGAGVKVAIR